MSEPMLVTAFFRYYRDYFAVRFRKVPKTDEQMVAWAFKMIPQLWDTRENTGHTFGEQIRGANSYKKGLVARATGTAFFVKFGVLLWPYAALILSKVPGLRAWYTNWKRAIARPDVYLNVSKGPFPKGTLEGLATFLPAAALGQHLYTYDRSEGWQIDDKTRFAELASKAGIPTAGVVPFSEVDPESEYLAKPTSGSLGSDIFLVKGSEVAEKVNKETHFLQKRLSNHRDIVALVGEGAALSTLRVDTLCSPEGDISHMVCVFRMGEVGSVVDNAHAGGVFSIVDGETGLLGYGATLATRRKGWVSAFTIKAHPHTGTEFANCFKPPFWEEARALCRKAHKELVPDIFRVSWDVALTDDGPILVEANCCLGGSFYQASPEELRLYYRTLREQIRSSNDRRIAA